MDHNEIFTELANRGAATAEVAFSGGNDEGWVEGIALKDAEGNVIGEVDSGYGTSDEFSEALQSPVWDRYGSFAGEFYVNGTAVWDVAERKVRWTGSEGQMEYRQIEEW